MPFKKSQGMSKNKEVKQKGQLMRRRSQSDPCVRRPPVVFTVLPAQTRGTCKASAVRSALLGRLSVHQLTPGITKTMMDLHRHVITWNILLGVPRVDTMQTVQCIQHFCFCLQRIKDPQPLHFEHIQHAGFQIPMSNKRLLLCFHTAPSY